MLTKRQKQALDFIRSYSLKKGYAPSLEEIKRHLGLSSVSTAHHHVQALEDLGYLSKADNQPRAINVFDQELMVEIPLKGKIAAGAPIEVIEDKETIAIPKNKIPTSSSVYALRVAGNSMIDENIDDGDIVLVKHQTSAENGQKVVALIDNQEATLKKFFKEKGFIRLQPANKKLDPLIYRKDHNVNIQGIVLDVIKKVPTPRTSFQDTLGFVEAKEKNKPDKKTISEKIGLATLIQADSMQWLENAKPNSIDAIVTDPPYGIVEFDDDQLAKRKVGKGGVWRIPPSFDGHVRSPLPRFTALDSKDRTRIYSFFKTWAQTTQRVLKPGGHVLIATNAFIAPLLYRALEDGGLEFRGEVIRLVRTLRGGDRPKNAEQEFADVCSLPRGCYEPWGIFRNKLSDGMRVQDSLRKFGTGGLRRLPNGNPFEDVIQSERTSQAERRLANHPSLKPQAFLRQLVYASLPLGKGVVLDPFMGSGSTLAAANALGLSSIGIEINPEFFEMSKSAVAKLSKLKI